MSCTIFSGKSYEWHIHQSKFDVIENSNTLKIKWLDEENNYVEAEELDFTLHDWLEQRLVEGFYR